MGRDMAAQFSLWPTFISRIRQLRAGTLSAEDLLDTRLLLATTMSRMDELEVVIDLRIALDETITLVPSQRTDSPFDKVFEFREGPSWSNLILWHCSYSFILNNVARFIDTLDADQSLGLKPLSKDATSTKYQKLLAKTCRIYEWTTFRRPLMATTSVLTLTTAYQYAQSDDLRDSDDRLEV